MAHPDFSSFLVEAGWDDASITPMSADAGLRRYFKLQKQNGETALFMDMSRSGYEASLDAFVNIGRLLKEKNIHVPLVHHVSLDQGFAIIEDFGQSSFGEQLAHHNKPIELYEIATNVLIDIRDRVPDNELRLGTYEESRIRERLSQFVEYYVPVASDVKVNAEIKKKFQTVMAQIQSNLSECPMGFVMRITILKT